MRSILATVLLVVPCLLALAPAVRGIDTPLGEPPYLAKEVRPKWRLAALPEVIEEIAREIELPVSPSEGVESLGDVSVVLIEEERATWREVLELLERHYDLAFTAEPLRLRIETGVEARARTRRLVNLDLRDYGIFFRAKRNLPTVRVVSYDEAGGEPSPFDFAGEEDNYELDHFLESVSEFIEEQHSAQVRGTGNLMVLATPEEEASLRRIIEGLYETALRRSRWRVHFGYLPAATVTAGGVVPIEEARAIAAALEEPERLTVGAMQNEEVLAVRARDEAIADDAEINQTGAYPVLNPVVLSARAGHSIRLRAIVGLERTLLIFSAEWAERLEPVRRGTIRVPPSLSDGTVDLQVTRKGEESTGRSSANLPPTHFRRGTEIEVQQRSIWSWTPRGEAFVPAGRGLILLGDRDGRRTAIVIEEVRS